MAKKLDFSVLSSVNTIGDIPKLYKEFINQMMTENLSDVRKNFEDGNDAFKKIYGLLNYMHMVNEKDEDVARLYNRIETIRRNNQKQSALEKVKEELLIAESGRNLSDLVEDYKSSVGGEITADTFQDNVLSEIINGLKDCKSMFRGSSQAFEEILTSAKAMQSAMRKMDSNKMSSDVKLKLTKVFAKNLMEKMNAYVTDRMDVMIEYGADSYKGKRVKTMQALSTSLQAYVNCVPVDKNVKLDKYAKEVIMDVFDHSAFDAKLFNRFSVNKLDDRAAEMFTKVYGHKIVPATLVFHEKKRMDTYNKMIDGAIKNHNNDAHDAVMASVSPDRKNLDMLKPMFGEQDKVTFSDITGNRALDQLIQKAGAARMEKEFVADLNSAMIQDEDQVNGLSMS